MLAFLFRSGIHFQSKSLPLTIVVFAPQNVFGSPSGFLSDYTILKDVV